MVSGPPKVAYTCLRNASVTVSAYLSGIGIAIGWLVRRHIHISIYEFLFELGGRKGTARLQAIE